MNKKIKNTYTIFIHTVPKIRRYCSMSQKFLTFNTPHEGLFLMFGVPNTKYLAFDTPDDNALKNV